jgi:hypothetical protein
MPNYLAVHAKATRDAERAGVQAINHEPDPTDRTSVLREWALRERSDGHEVSWYEFASAASAGLSIYALLAAGAERTKECDIDRIYSAYFPWISAVTTMLDSYVDQAEDALAGDHSYISYYPAPASVVPGIARLTRRSLDATSYIQVPERHRVIIACMITLHLSRDSARSASLRMGARQLARAGGALTVLLMPVLRLWRVAYSQRST